MKSSNSLVITTPVLESKPGLSTRKTKRPRKAQLFAYCAERGIAHQRCGKLLVATSDDQLPQLQAIIDKAADNGVNDLVRLTQNEA